MRLHGIPRPVAVARDVLVAVKAAGDGRQAVGPAGPRLINVSFRAPPEQPEGKAA